jgi:hypothetical protein
VDLKPNVNGNAELSTSTDGETDDTPDQGCRL